MENGNWLIGTDVTAADGANDAVTDSECRPGCYHLVQVRRTFSSLYTKSPTRGASRLSDIFVNKNENICPVLSLFIDKLFSSDFLYSSIFTPSR